MPTFTIRDGSSVEINIGDEFESHWESANLATVIGIKGACVAYTFIGINGRRRVNSKLRQDYGIPSEWPDGTECTCTGQGYIIAVYPKDTAKAKPTTKPVKPIVFELNAQARSAAWGQENYVAREGAAFKFL